MEVLQSHCQSLSAEKSRYRVPENSIYWKQLQQDYSMFIVLKTTSASTSALFLVLTGDFGLNQGQLLSV